MPVPTRKHVVLVALPRLMEDLVRRACIADGAISVEESTASLDDLLPGLMTSPADVVIVGIRADDMPSIPRALLERRPRLRVLLVAMRDADAELYELRPHRARLGAVSPAEIVRAVRDDEAHDEAWTALGPGMNEASR